MHVQTQVRGEQRIETSRAYFATALQDFQCSIGLLYWRLAIHSKSTLIRKHLHYLLFFLACVIVESIVNLF